MDSTNLLTVLVGVIAAVMVVQGIAMVAVLVSLKKSSERMQAKFSEFARDVQPLLQLTRELLVESKEKITAISAKVDALSEAAMEIAEIAKGQATRIDGMLNEVTDHARLHLIRLDRLIEDTICRVEETGETVRRTILVPVREISALVAGVRTSLDYLFRRRKARSAAPVTQDEELFI